MLLLDGSTGEGGGQVLRTSLSLSALTGRAFRMENIRAGRSQPGLRPQHLTAVQAVADVVGADVDGDVLGSTTLTFVPNQRPRAGEYFFDVTQASPSRRSAGSVTLILQAILWPLLFSDGSSLATLSGGTFVPFSPPFHYLDQVLRPAYLRLGITIECDLVAWGWMSAGGGEVKVKIEASDRLHAAQFDGTATEAVEGVAAVTNLPSHIPHRMARRAQVLLAEAGFQPAVEPLRKRGAGPGAGIVLWLPQAGFSSLGRPGLPAEKVAETAVADLLSFIDNGSAVDQHLADQLLIPMALAQGESSFTTNRLTHHTMTNIDLLRSWLDVSITVNGRIGAPGAVSVSGVGWTGTEDNV